MPSTTKWRRTAFEDTAGNVEIAPDDWTLLDPSGMALARLYKVSGGPQDGRWYWTVLVRTDGSAESGGTGFVATGREAREAREARARPKAIATVQMCLWRRGALAPPRRSPRPKKEPPGGRGKFSNARSS
jgi:hypothetical protein